MSEKNDQIVDVGLSRLLDQFQDSTGLLALASVYLGAAQTFEDAAYQLLVERDINQMTGDRLDGLGTVTKQFRSGLSDDDFRQQLKAELAVLRSQGTSEEILAIAQLLIEMPTADYESYELYPKGLYVRPVDYPITAGADRIASKLNRAVSATTDMLFVWSEVADAATYTLSSQASTVETSTALGLADVAVSPVVGSSSVWRFDPTTSPGAASMFFRLNSAVLGDVTACYINQTDRSATLQDAYLASLANGSVYIQGGGELYLFDVSNVVDSGIYYTLTVTGGVTSLLGGTIASSTDCVIYSLTPTGGRLGNAG